MIIKLKKMHELMRPENYKKLEDSGDSCILNDGVYFSKTRPMTPDWELEDGFEMDTEKDFVCMPGETDTMYFWKGEKPKYIFFGGQGNHGSSLDFKSEGEEGYYTVCFEDD